MNLLDLNRKPEGIYLDSSSTSPPFPEVIDIISNIQSNFWANPSSLHRPGIEARDILERARLSISNHFNCDPSDLLFTSGSTESINLALIGSAKLLSPGRIVISRVEHPAVYQTALELVKYGWTISFWNVDEYGMVLLSDIDKMLDNPTKIVSINWAQSEVGTIQPIEIISKECNRRGITFHTDATQIVSHKYIDWAEKSINFLSCSAHKFQGPKGIGLLLCKNLSDHILSPLIKGGGQERGFRSGTEPVALAAGMATALECNKKRVLSLDRNGIYKTSITDITSELRNRIKDLDGFYLTGHPTNRIPNHISLTLATSNGVPIDSRVVVRSLSKRNVYISSGSACNNGKNIDSAVLLAMNYGQKWLKSGIRLTLGDWINVNQLDLIQDALIECINEVSN